MDKLVEVKELSVCGLGTVMMIITEHLRAVPAKGQDAPVAEPCPVCEGSGDLFPKNDVGAFSGKPCLICGGNGRKPKQKGE